jgi:hypothetical protein
MHGRITLKWIGIKYCLGPVTGFLRPMIGNSDQMLWTVMNLWLYKKNGDLFTNQKIDSILRRTLLHGVMLKTS